MSFSTRGCNQCVRSLDKGCDHWTLESALTRWSSGQTLRLQKLITCSIISNTQVVGTHLKPVPHQNNLEAHRNVRLTWLYLFFKELESYA